VLKGKSTNQPKLASLQVTFLFPIEKIGEKAIAHNFGHTFFEAFF